MGMQKEWIDALADRLAPGVQEMLRSKGRPEELIEVIIEYESSYGYHRSRMRKAILASGGVIKREFPIINSFAVQIPVSGLQKLVTGRVKKVWSDAKVKPCLDIAVPAIHGDMARKAGYTGKGVTVAIIDTGIDPHQDLTTPENRIVGFKDFVNDQSKPYDDNGHGTHVAGIVAGNGGQSAGKYMGVAPEARLVGVKVLDQDGSGNISQVVSGVDWVIQNKRRFRIDIINLSLGGPAEDGYQNDPMSRIVEEAWRRGMVVCAAAGNEGPRSASINTPGIAPSIITVGNMDDRNTEMRKDDQLDESSSRGPTVDKLVKPDILAPGTNIVSLKAGGGYISHTGTSMATPMVSGAAALMLQQNPKLTPGEIKTLLMSSAEDRGYEEDMQGKGYLDLLQPLGLNDGAKTPDEGKMLKKKDIVEVLLAFLPQLIEKGKKADPRPMVAMLVKKMGLCEDMKNEPKEEKTSKSKGFSSLWDFLNMKPGTFIGLLAAFKDWLAMPGLPF